MRRLFGANACLLLAIAGLVVPTAAQAERGPYLRVAGTDPSARAGDYGTFEVDENSATTIVAVYRTGSGDPIADRPITFTVDLGWVDAPSATTPDRTQRTVTLHSDANGQAEVSVGSETSGTQSLTVSATGAGKTGSTTFRPGETAVSTVTPTGATVRRGTSQDYVAEERDRFGNLTPDVMCFDVDGPGEITATSGYPDDIGYDTDGRLTGTLTVPVGASPGRFTIGSHGNCSGDAPTSRATTTYTVPNEPAISAVTAYLAHGAAVGSTTDFASSEVSNAEGQGIAGAVVQFDLSGSTTTGGTATTDSSGLAVFPFVPQHAGAVTATVSYPGDGAVPFTKTTGSTAKGAPTTRLTQISPQPYRIRDTATVGLKQAGLQVDFYQRLVSGHYKYVGTDDTDARGVAVFTHYALSYGYRYTGVAKVSGGNADYNGPNSNAVTTAVR